MSTAHEAFGVAAEPLAFDVMRGIWQRNRTRIESTTTTLPAEWIKRGSRPCCLGAYEREETT